MRLSRLLFSGVCVAFLVTGVGLGSLLKARLEPPIVAAPAPQPLPLSPGPDFASIARRATPAVVNISALQIYRTERAPFFSDPFFQEFFPQQGPFRMPQEERKTSLGSGVFVGADGLIVTNNHVIEHAKQISITTADKRRLRATLVGTDPVTDIAVIRVVGGAFPFLPWGDSSKAAVGEYVLAVGNPYQLSQTVTMGIISATGRSNVGIVDYEDFIQTDAAINPGNSGGALVNVRGELIGINTAIYSQSGGYSGIGFAVPANLAHQVMDQLVAHGRVVRGFVGITRVTNVTDENAAELGLREAKGVLVVELLRASPAQRAGLEPGAVVVAVDGQPLEDAAQLRNLLARLPVGASLHLSILRSGRRLELKILVGEAGSDA
jgi:Do/DeqQ family serine protease